MKKEFVMRGQTAYNTAKSEYEPETLNFSGFKDGYAYKITEFSLYPGSGIGTSNFEGTGAVTASKTAVNSIQPDFNDEGLIATTYYSTNTAAGQQYQQSVVNDTFLITQNLILTVRDSSGVSPPPPINWQCRFKPVKMAKAEEAVANYKQFMISDGS